MSPGNIVEAALEKGLDILGITDHNSTLNAVVVQEIAARDGLLVLTGAEVTTREEIHCLCFFEKHEELSEFQKWLELNITRVPNSPGRFGYQVVVDKDENITDEVEYMLLMSLRSSIGEVESKVHELNGIFIPAHIDRSVNSILSQLGFFPQGIRYDAIEITPSTDLQLLRQLHPVIAGVPVIRSSDSHFPGQVGRFHVTMLLEEPSFSEIRKAFMGIGGRRIESV